MELLKDAAQLKSTMQEHYQFLHAHAETGFDLPETTAYVKRQLDRLQIPWKACGKSGIIGMIEGNKAGKTVLLRADMDALPIKEATSLPFACKTGSMHACGHDMHTAMLLGAAEILLQHQDEICGNVKLMFQPAEEILSGAKDMIEAGALENPKVDAAFMIHVASQPELPVGTLVIPSEGTGAAAVDYFTITVTGTSAHGAMPYKGADPVTAAANIILALQQIQTRELPLRQNVTLTLGTVNGGTAANVIAQEVVMKGTLRSSCDASHSFAKKRMEEICQWISKALRVKADVRYDMGSPSFVNDDKLAKIAANMTQALLGSERVIVTSSSGGGSEDFSYVSRLVPSLMLVLSAGKEGMLHNAELILNEEAMISGAAVHACLALEFLRIADA